MPEQFLSNYPHLAGRRVLVVDDESDLREIVGTLFQRLGCPVIEAKNGGAAIALLGRESVDVVITDVRMSGGDGVELLRQVRLKDPKRPAVILVTGFSDLPEEDALKLGASAVIAKPFRLQTLVEAVSKALGF